MVTVHTTSSNFLGIPLVQSAADKLWSPDMESRKLAPDIPSLLNYIIFPKEVQTSCRNLLKLLTNMDYG